MSEASLIHRFTFYHIIGWDKDDDHFDVMKLPAYATFRSEMKEFHITEKDVVFYHFDLKKHHGDW